MSPSIAHSYRISPNEHQRGNIFLHQLHHGIDFKQACIHTEINCLRRQQLCFEPDLRLILTLQGKTHLNLAGKDIYLAANTRPAGALLSITQPVYGDKIFYEGKQHELVVFFSNAWLAQLCDGHALQHLLWQTHLQAHYFVPSAAILAQVSRLQNTLALPLAWRSLHQEAQCIALLAEVLHMLFPEEATLSDTGNHIRQRRLSRLLALLHNTETDHYTIDDLAHACHSNSTTLQQDFMDEYGQGIAQYRRMLKLEQARLLLRQRHSVSAVANLIGYRNVECFSRAFKKYYGCPPSMLLRWHNQ